MRDRNQFFTGKCFCYRWLEPNSGKGDQSRRQVAVLCDKCEPVSASSTPSLGQAARRPRHSASAAARVSLKVLWFCSRGSATGCTRRVFRDARMWFSRSARRSCSYMAASGIAMSGAGAPLTHRPAPSAGRRSFRRTLLETAPFSATFWRQAGAWRRFGSAPYGSPKR